MKHLFALIALLTGVGCHSDPKTLVIMLAETRAHELTYNNIDQNLLKVLNADLAVAIGVSPHYNYDNPFYRNAKYKFSYPEPSDYAQAFDFAYDEIIKDPQYKAEASMPWREFLKIKDQFLGGIRDLENEHPGSAGILLFYRWFLLKNLVDQGLLDKYDYFIVTRSDYIYQLPHPSTHLLSPDLIYIPDGEQYGGVTDRHVVLPKKFVVAYLNILSTMVLKAKEYYEKMKSYSNWNLEQLIQFHLREQGVLDSVRFFPYVMYTVRPIDGTTRWSKGDYSEKHGYFIKYPSEYELSSKHKADCAAAGDDLDAFYQSRIGK